MKNELNNKGKYNNLLKKLSDRTRDVVERRFGLGKEKRETLESIGETYDICRERVRQIELAGIDIIKEEIERPAYCEVFQGFKDYLEKKGGLRREDLLLSQFPSPEEKNQALFWLTLGKPFFKFSETDEFYPVWTIDPDLLDLAGKIIGSFIKEFKKQKELVPCEKISKTFKKEPSFECDLSPQSLISFLEISKKIEQNSEGCFGLQEWPEVNPKGVKDRAYLALKKKGDPLHFVDVANFIDKLELGSSSSTLPQTVHNELIRDPRFVLVGRGIYAMKEWGYTPGQVKDVILEILKNQKEPLSKKDVIEKVLSQRIVKENTILLNLQNKKYFSKDSKEKYTIKKG